MSDIKRDLDKATEILAEAKAAGLARQRQWPKGAVQSIEQANGILAAGFSLFRAFAVGEHSYLSEYTPVTKAERDEWIKSHPEFADSFGVIACCIMNSGSKWITDIDRNELKANLAEHYNDHFVFSAKADAEVYIEYCRTDAAMLETHRQHLERCKQFDSFMGGAFADFDDIPMFDDPPEPDEFDVPPEPNRK